MEEENKKQKSEEAKEKELIQIFTAQLKKIVEADKSSKQYRTRAGEIKNMAHDILHQFEKQKERILRKLGSGVLLPGAKEIVDDLSRFTDELKENLERNLKESELAGEVNWRDHAKLWAQLYAKWHDQKALEEEIIQFLSQRSSEMIAKDIQVIDEYQNRTLEDLNVEEQQLDTLKERMKKVIEDPLKAMHKLKDSPCDMSLEKIGEWISRIQEQREEHFDSLLMRIEGVVGEVQQFSDFIADPALEAELQYNIASLEMEYKDLESLLSSGNLEKKEKVEIKAHLDSLLMDGRELLDQLCSSKLRNSLEQIIQKIASAISLLS